MNEIDSMAKVPKRVLADIAELQEPLYASQGIYYIPSETNALEGTALIFGPAGTPYEDCPMLYKFEIPQTFPFDNPKVTFHTFDGKTRFHPNMYTEGKCCLSILGTWEGPRWASTMRLSTILITLQSLMDTDPLCHEPGYSSGKNRVIHDEYAKAVEFACMRYIVQRATPTVQTPSIFEPFIDIFQERIPAILKRLEARLVTRLEQGEFVFRYLPYSAFLEKTQYQTLLSSIQKLVKEP